MKRFLLIPSFAFLALSALTSCQKEEKTALELTQELTAELQKVTDYRTAEAAAPRVEVLNKRMRNAGARAFALNDPALTRSMIDSEGSEGAAYAEALAQLAAEVGRIQASAPVDSEGAIDRDRLMMAIGSVSGSSPDAPAGDRKKAGVAYINDATSTHDTPGSLGEYYGSEKLRAALSYKADPASFALTKMDSDEDVPAIPAAVEVPEEEIPADEEPATDDEPATTVSDEPAADEPSVDEPAADDSDEPSIDDSSDEPVIDDAGDEPAVDEPSLDGGDEPSLDGGDEPSLDDEPAGDDDLGGDIVDDGGDDSGDISVDLDL